jgi:hypothetical protein
LEVPNAKGSSASDGEAGSFDELATGARYVDMSSIKNVAGNTMILQKLTRSAN